MVLQQQERLFCLSKCLTICKASWAALFSTSKLKIAVEVGFFSVNLNIKVCNLAIIHVFFGLEINADSLLGHHQTERNCVTAEEHDD